jgi:hypothetical protein
MDTSSVIVGIIMPVAVVVIVGMIWRERYSRFFDEP